MRLKHVSHHLQSFSFCCGGTGQFFDAAIRKIKIGASQVRQRSVEKSVEWLHRLGHAINFRRLRCHEDKHLMRFSSSQFPFLSKRWNVEQNCVEFIFGQGIFIRRHHTIVDRTTGVNETRLSPRQIQLEAPKWFVNENCLCTGSDQLLLHEPLWLLCELLWLVPSINIVLIQGKCQCREKQRTCEQAES